MLGDERFPAAARTRRVGALHPWEEALPVWQALRPAEEFLAAQGRQQERAHRVEARPPRQPARRAQGKPPLRVRRAGPPEMP